MTMWVVFGVIAMMLVGFALGPVRYDIIALSGLIFLTLLGIVPTEGAFQGFSHPAVVSVVAILIVSQGLIKAGTIGKLVAVFDGTSGRMGYKIAGLMVLTAVLSSIMNNVGALALVMPIALQIAKNDDISPSYLLMPVAFASLLGGLITEIGTPPNLIISMIRAEETGTPFQFFSFSKVGVTVTVFGIAFVSLYGWRLIPRRKKPDDTVDAFSIEGYLIEMVVSEESKIAGKALKAFKTTFGLDLNVLRITRQTRNIIAPLGSERLEVGDVLLVKADHGEITRCIQKTRLKIKGSEFSKKDSGKMLNSDDYTLIEVVVKDDSVLIHRTAETLSLRQNYGVNLVAVSRKGHASVKRLKQFRFKAGDVLLIQVKRPAIREMLTKLRCLPLANRGVEENSLFVKHKSWLAGAIFAASVVCISTGILPVEIAFSAAAIGMVFSQILTLKEFYDAIEWPVIMLLGAMIPVGKAMETTGGADYIAQLLFALGSNRSPIVMIAVLMALTMGLTNLINNAAAAVIMAPIAIRLAHQMGTSVDPMLMAVAVASSCAFLTPIGHQSNTLIMGPGGYKFGDYWRMGLPLSLIILMIGTLSIYWFFQM